MRSQNAEELPKKATITLRFPSFVSQWGFSHSATSAAELEVRDSTHEYDQRGTGWNNLASWNRKRPRVTFNSYLESKVCTGTTHRGEVFLFVPVGTEMSVGAAAALSLSAQHGRRLDSNLSGLRYQQTGGGYRVQGEVVVVVRGQGFLQKLQTASSWTFLFLYTQSQWWITLYLSTILKYIYSLC